MRMPAVVFVIAAVAGAAPVAAHAQATTVISNPSASTGATAARSKAGDAGSGPKIRMSASGSSAGVVRRLEHMPARARPAKVGKAP